MELISAFFQHQLTMKMFHFQTKKYGAHKAADAYLLKYGANFDRFMEAWQGRNGRLTQDKVEVGFYTVDDTTIFQHLDDMSSFLTKIDLDQQVDLAAIRDEMVADIEQLKYLLTFN